MKKIYKAFAGTLSFGVAALLACTLIVQARMPDLFYVAAGEEFYINKSIIASQIQPAGGALPVQGDSGGNFYNMNLKLLGKIPVKQVQVQVIERKSVVPGGCAFGIKMHTQGVIVVGMSDIQIGTQNMNPAKSAGLKVGDVLTAIDDMEIISNQDVAQIISESGGSEVKLTALRDGEELEFSLTPVQSEYDGGYKAGIWVRDSSAGIGTLTYYDPETLGFGGLGHAICDIDTGGVMPLNSGEIVDVNILGVNVGQSGKPGELKGAFVGAEPLGNLYLNSESGIFGVLNFPILESDPIPLALKQEIEPGPATIFATISGNKPRAYDIEIEKVNYSDTTPSKNMVIRVVDEALLASSGGIVQGMSGSPIIQNGRLCGAVTHVFVNDPTRGYGIFAENMEKMLNIVEGYQIDE